MPDSLPIGSEVAHYRIIAAIGAGGMGEVYQAHDQRLQRGIALKILPPHLVSNQDRLRRFVQEARSASGLNHPHIVTIHDIGEARLTSSGGSDSEVHYIAMELVVGASLRAKLNDDGAELREVVRWMSQVAEGLAKAHAAGIVHRDLKPENIMVSGDGYAKVLDFGLAKLTQRIDSEVDEATQVRNETGEGVIVGTTAYMSPEQVRGRAVDHRSDIFSFGCILYEAATGELPFRGSTKVDLMHNILHQRPDAVHELNPRVPNELRRMIRRCLAKDPDKRYQSMKDLAIELAEMYEEWDELANDSSSTSAGSQPMTAPARVPRKLIAGAAAALLLLVAAVVFWSMLRGRSTDSASLPAMSFAPVTMAAGLELFPRLSPDGTFVLYTASGGDDWDLFLLRVGGRNPINLTESSTANDSSGAFSPDGQTIAFTSERDGGGIFLMGATGESVRRLTDTGHFPSWSPDGKQIVYCTDDSPTPFARNRVSELWVVDVATAQKRKIHDGDAIHPRWSPDGKRIAFWALLDFAGGQRDLATIPAGGGPVQWLTRDAHLDWWPVWAPDSRSIYFSSDRGGSLNLWNIGIDPESGKPRGEPRPLTTPSKQAADFDISKDGSRLIFDSWETTANIVRMKIDPTSLEALEQPVYITRGGEQLIEPYVSPDGEWVVCRTTGRQDDLVLVKSDGSQIRQLTEDVERDRGPRWTPDGQRIVMFSSRNGRYEFWSIRPDGSGLQQMVRSTGDTTWFPFMSPDGKTIAGFNESGSALFDLSGTLPSSRRQNLPPVDGNDRFLAADWSPDGTELLGVRSVGPGRYDRLIVYSLATKRYTTLLDVSGITFVTFVPGERRVIYSTEHAIHAFDPATGKRHVVAEFPDRRLSRISLPKDRAAIYFGFQSQESDLWLGTLAAASRQ